MRLRPVLLALALFALLAAGCDWPNIVPSGPAPLRYRDAIFSSVTVTSNVTYGSAVNLENQTIPLQLDLYQPTGDTVTSRPAIVWVHGGFFSSGNKTSGELVDEATTFSKEGYVNVSINYRLASGCSAGTPTAACVTSIVDAKHDAQAAVRFLRANAAAYGVDPTRIAVAGTSAGAITALNVGFDPTDPGTSGNPGFSSAAQAAVALSGAAILTTPGSGDAPSLLFHGTADPLVPYQWAVNTQADATAAGLVSELTTWTGDGHVPYVAHRDQILSETTNFLFWTLNLTSAAH